MTPTLSTGVRDPRCKGLSACPVCARSAVCEGGAAHPQDLVALGRLVALVLQLGQLWDRGGCGRQRRAGPQ
jgi:hypothetical protein